MQETGVQSLGQDDPLEKEKAIHSSVLAWKIPRTEERGGAAVHGLARVEHDLTATKFSQSLDGWKGVKGGSCC